MVDTADSLKLVPQLNQRLKDIQRSRTGLGQELAGLDATLDECIGSVDVAFQRLKALRAAPRGINQPVVPPLIPSGPAAAAPAPGMSLDDFKSYIEKLLQGSLEAASDKISDRIMHMLKELKGLAGSAREAKLQELREVAESEMVDLSQLFTHEEVQSNLGEVGVEEKESKAIDSSLAKLRAMRGLKPKSGDAPKDQQKG